MNTKSLYEMQRIGIAMNEKECSRRVPTEDKIDNFPFWLESQFAEQQTW